MVLGIGKKSSAALLGIDFGSATIKGLLLSKSSKGFKVESVAEVDTPAGALVDNQVVSPEEITEALRELKRKLPSRNRQVATAVAGSHVITKVIYMDSSLSELELETQVELEAENSIPFPIDEISLDFEVLGINESEPNRNNVLLSAARTEAVSIRAEVLANADFEAKVVDVESHALGRAWNYLLNQRDEEFDESKIIGLVDIGETTLNFAILDKGEVVYNRAQNFGGAQYTQQIASFYSLSLDEAKEMKVSGRLPENYEIDVFAQFVSGVIQNVRRQVSLFLSSSGYKSLDAVAVSGGSALSDELVRQMQNDLEMPVIKAEPFDDCQFDRSVDRDKLRQQGGKYMVALGLALRSFDNV
ncbi:type IV pilus assembly protein PilM [Agarivorans sp. MS3-6]|uniref:type IV pilus assembly protein PilM n=1 Tax=Agarivorans sp. TSD2052 TaxID=2937286 RepID=UPI00200EC22D|nr:type IV pilus assembly protein PilM [Agarivorans sp. TSD2052]UPW19149.1 pilus assembly protein PilM [Agarivorans sp. TSD2052]